MICCTQTPIDVVFIAYVDSRVLSLPQNGVVSMDRRNTPHKLTFK